MIVTLASLIDEYKEMAQICYHIDYSNKKSVKNNNKAVDRMYQIVNIINSDFGGDGINEFKKLIYYKENKTDLWAAVHMLEKMEIDKATMQKALTIIKQEAKQSVGLEYWLKAYEKNRLIK